MIVGTSCNLSAMLLVWNRKSIYSISQSLGQVTQLLIVKSRLVDEITFTNASLATNAATQSAILGPFFRHDHPVRENGSTISFDTPKDAEVVYMHGKVLDTEKKQPIANASIDVWQASTNGKYIWPVDVISCLIFFLIGYYEQQDEHQVDSNLRGKFYTGPQGEYSFYCLRPTPYPIPDDGPAGKLLHLLDRHPYRPAHIHLIVRIFFSSSFFTVALT